MKKDKYEETGELIARAVQENLPLKGVEILIHLFTEDEPEKIALPKEKLGFIGKVAEHLYKKDQLTQIGLKVLYYIVQKEKDGVLDESIRDVAAGSGVSYLPVQKFLTSLDENGIIEREWHTRKSSMKINYDFDKGE